MERINLYVTISKEFYIEEKFTCHEIALLEQVLDRADDFEYVLNHQSGGK